MSASVNPPRGMRDFLPAEKRARDQVIAEIVATYRQHGFEAIETPVMEDHAVIHSGLGGDNEKLSFPVLRRGLDMEQVRSVSSLDDLTDLSLRFDLTVPLARFVATHQAELPPVFRALHVAPVWRAERPQKGRFRQFTQCDIDIVGEPGTLAEREVLVATSAALDRIGLESYRFRVNDRRFLSRLMEKASIDPSDHAPALITLDKLDKIGRDGVMAELAERVSGNPDLAVIDRLLAEAEGGSLPLDAKRIVEWLGVEPALAQSFVSWTSDLADEIGRDRVVWDPTLVRGMGYYTGSIVELQHPGLGVSLGGGGRYDGMIGRFLQRDVPAFGFSLGFERLMEVLGTPAVRNPQQVAVLYGEETPVGGLIGLKRALIAQGLSVRLVASQKNMRPVFERLDADGFSRVTTVSDRIPDADQLVWREIGS